MKKFVIIENIHRERNENFGVVKNIKMDLGF